MSTQRKFLVIGGAGAQGLPIVKALATDSSSTIRVFTRSTTSANAKLLSSISNVSLQVGSSTSEPDLRAAFKDITHAFVNLNSFVLGQKAETYWGIRIFEIAVESGVKHFIWSSLDNVLKDSGYDEALRCGHYEGKARVAQWMKAQPQNPMSWSVLTTGPYVEMLNETQRPKQDEDGVYVFRAPLGDGAVPYIHLDDLGEYVRWIFDNPSESMGFDLKIATEHIGYAELAAAFTAVTGKAARYENLSMEVAFEKNGSMSPEHKLGSEYEGPDDDTLMTVRQNFTAWWRIYQRCADNKGVIQRDYEMLDRILPTRVKSVREWMEKTGYSAEHKPLLNRGGQ
jgi:uncharacterized protein YbjT (DUF2867 family)